MVITPDYSSITPNGVIVHKRHYEMQCHYAKYHTFRYGWRNGVMTFWNR